MKKLLNTRDILLLGLSGALDLFEELKDPFSLVSKSYENMYGWVPRRYKRNNFMHLVWRNIKTGYIEKIEQNGEIYIRLTAQGNKRIVRDFPLLLLQRRRWDKKWRIVIFDIQEINRGARDGLRKKLRELGFGMLQESVFISPHDIIKDLSEFIDNWGLSEAVYTFEGSNLLVGDTETLVNRVWNLDALNEKYREIVDKIENSHLTNARGSVNMLNDSGKESTGELVKELREKYLEVLIQDPFLPKDLLPQDWAGEKARILITSLKLELHTE